jgi:hypothetical protein
MNFSLMRLVLLWVVVAIVAGCATQPVKLTTRFNPAEAQYINGKGKAQIAGQLFRRRNDGIVVYGAGSEVRLTPATAYARERISDLYGAGKVATSTIKFADENPEYRQFTRVVKANGEGRFLFTDVAPGTYFVTGPVTWCVSTQYGCDTQGGSLMETANITATTEKLDIVMDGQ